MSIQEIKDSRILKVKIFSHNDLDGISCFITLKKLYNTKNIIFNPTFIDYSNIDEISKFFKNYDEAREYDFIFITDINIKEFDFNTKIQPAIDEFITNKNNAQNVEKENRFKKVFIIDHHKDSERTFSVNQTRIFNTIECYINIVKCGAFNLFDWCMEKKSSLWTSYTIGQENSNLEMNKQWLEEYLSLVNDWDLFLWKNNHNLPARDLNILFTHIRREKFIMMQEQKESIHFAFNKTEKTIIKETMETINREFERALKSHTVIKLRNPILNEYSGFNAVVFKTDDDISLITDMFREMIIDGSIFGGMKIDILINVSFKYGSINFRRIKDNVDLVEIANWYGGGGHPFAAGCKLNAEDKNLMNDIVYPLVYAAYKSR